MSKLTFRIGMPEPHTHLFEVAVEVQAPNEDLVFEMPAWTPGSYLIREYARQVQDVTAYDQQGNERPVQKVEKAAWRVDCDGWCS